MTADARGARGRSDAAAAAAVLAYLNRSDYRPIPQRQLLHRMHVSAAERPVVRRLLQDLIREGRVLKLRGGRLAAAATGETVTGLLHRHRDGYGFVTPDAGGEDLYVAARNMGDALSGDRVAARRTRGGRTGRTEGLVLRVLEKRTRVVLGLFEIRGRGGTVQPFDPALSDAIPVPAAFRMGAGQFDIVRVELLRSADGGSPEGKVLEVLGHMDDPATDILVLARKYGLDLEFPEEVLDAAEGLPSRIGPKEASNRERFDDPSPVTIDGETAKDFDDAIAVVSRPRGGFRLFVHIADVGHFVPVGGVLDLEARRRGTSVYFPHRVIPMFPEKLSNDLCSLRPGVDRLVQSAVLDFDASGAPTRVRFADGVIRSAGRLTYTQVASVLEGKSRVKGVPAKLVPMLKTANRLREVLERRRHARGSVDLDLPEPQILLDVEGVMTGVTIEPRNEAHRLIEEFMLAANEAVALELDRRGHPCMFRVHDPPDPTKIEALVSFVRGFGIKTKKLSVGIVPGDVQALLDPFQDRPEYSVVSQIALRSMKRARYTMENIGHFGLAAPHYCHFTSPIRRYPDLVVHRLLRAARSRKRTRPPWIEGLELVAEGSSDLERNAEAAERELLVRKKIAFIADRVGDVFSGIVTGVTSFGLFVQLTENLVEGLVRADNLGAERFEFIESRFELRGSRTGKTFRLGDRLEVRVDAVDRVLQRVDFSLESAPRRRGTPGQRRGREAAGRARTNRRRQARRTRGRSTRRG